MNMISTGAFLPEMDASNKQETLAEKFARVWEKKNSKAARAGGVSLMALSLAACGSDSAEVAEEEVEDTPPPVVTPDGVDETLTSEEDTFIGVSGGDDTFTATSATLSADDNIVDGSATDSDTLNVTLTAAAPVMDVVGIEAININWDSLLTPTVDLDDVSGATVTLTTARAGQNGNANVDNADANNVTFGAGFDGTVTVDGLDGANVVATAADNVDVGTGTAADGVISVTASVATTVNVTGGDEVTVSAVAGDDITIDGGDAEVVNLTVGVDADLDLVANAVGVSTITSNAAEAIELTIANGFTSNSTTLVGDINLSAEVADVTGETITGAGVVTISDAIADIDISDITADSFVFETTAGGNAAITVASGQSLTIDGVALGGDITIRTTAADDAAADSINLTLDTETGANAIIVDTANQDIETVNITVAAAATFVDTQPFNIADIQGNSAGGTTINLTQADAAVELSVDAFDAAALDGSAVAGELSVTQTTTETLSIVGAAGATTAVFAGVAVESTFESTNAADDSVTFVTQGGGATAVYAGGDNTTLANALTTGTLTVTAGAGDDVVEIDGITSGHATLSLGDGDNTVRVGATDNVAGASITITTGTGDNTLVVEGDTAAGTALTVDFGTGTGTLDLGTGEDMTAGTITMTGLDTIDIGSATTAAIVNATLLDGQSYTIVGDGTAGDQLSVEMDNTAATSVDFSGLVISAGVTTALAGLSVTGTNLGDTVVLTDGNDTYDSQDGNDTITGGDGDDDLTAGAGNDTFLIAFGGEGADTIREFTTGGTDVIDFTGTSDVVDGGAVGGINVGAYEDVVVIAAGADATNGAGFSFVTDSGGNSAADLTVANAAAFLTDIDGAGAGGTNFVAENANDDFYIAITDGTDVGIYFYEGDGNDTVIDAADLTLLVTLDGVTSIANANIADFV